MRARGLLVGAAVLSSLAAAGAAKEASDTGLWPDPRPPATMRRLPVTDFRVGNFHGILEKTTLADVIQAFGGRAVGNGKDGAEADASLCYSLPWQEDTQRLRFSSGEFEGHTRIDRVALELGAPPSGCPAPRNRVSVSVTLGPGLYLGMPAADVIARVGRPSGQSGDPLGKGGRMVFHYDKPVRAGDPVVGTRAVSLSAEGFVVTNLLSVRTVAGRVTGLGASLTTQN